MLRVAAAAPGDRNADRARQEVVQGGFVSRPRRPLAGASGAPEPWEIEEVPCRSTVKCLAFFRHVYSPPSLTIRSRQGPTEIESRIRPLPARCSSDVRPMEGFKLFRWTPETARKVLGGQRQPRGERADHVDLPAER